MQGAAGLRKNGVGSASGTVSGFRYNARLLAQEIAKRLGHKQEVAALDATRSSRSSSPSSARGPRSGRRRDISRGPSIRTGARHRPPGALPRPLRAGSIAVTIEMNAEGEIYPVAYCARARRSTSALPPHHLNDFGGDEYRRALESLL
jgi:hypothetical protein